MLDGNSVQLREYFFQYPLWFNPSQSLVESLKGETKSFVIDPHAMQ